MFSVVVCSDLRIVIYFKVWSQKKILGFRVRKMYDFGTNSNVELGGLGL